MSNIVLRKIRMFQFNYKKVNKQMDSKLKPLVIKQIKLR